MILTPDKLWTRADVLSKPCPVPREGGVYGWYFDSVPPGIVAANHHTVGMASLLYVGISPKAPPKNGARPSKQTMRERIRYHYQGNAEGSTLRLTLGCLLSEELDIELRRVGSGTRMTFAWPPPAPPHCPSYNSQGSLIRGHWTDVRGVCYRGLMWLEPAVY